jgi:UPF0716 protein FxsA
MLLALLVLFVVAPLAELYVIVQVSHSIGPVDTILLLFAVSAVGAWLAKRQGIAVLRRMQATVADGRVPSRELVDGALILLAAALMIAPGFLSDCLAILLLLPPSRAAVRGLILRQIRAGGGVVSVISTPIRRRRSDGSEVWDVDSWEDPPHPPTGRPELGP